MSPASPDRYKRCSLTLFSLNISCWVKGCYKQQPLNGENSSWSFFRGRVVAPESVSLHTRMAGTQSAGFFMLPPPYFQVGEPMLPLALQSV